MTAQLCVVPKSCAWVDAHQLMSSGWPNPSCASPVRTNIRTAAKRPARCSSPRRLRDLGCRVDVFSPLEVVGLPNIPRTGRGATTPIGPMWWE